MAFLTLPTVRAQTNGDIAFTSYRDGNGEIYVMDAKGMNLNRLTNNSFGDSDPS